MSQESQDQIESNDTTTSFHFNTGSAFGALKDSFSPAFWKPVVELFKQSKRHFIKPAAMLAAGPCIIMAGFYFGSLGMGDGVQDLIAVMLRYLVCFTIGTLSGTLLIVWSISDWIFKLTSISRSHVYGLSLQESMDYLKHRKTFMFVAWLVYLILSSPFVLFLIASSILSLMQSPLIPQPLILPDHIKTIADTLSLVGIIFTTMYAALLISVSGTSNSSGSSAALAAFVGTFKTFAPLFIYAILANIVYCVTLEIVLTVVSILMSVQNYSPQMWDLVAIIFSSSILRGIASFFVLPFLIAVPAEITKRAIKN